MPRAQEIKKTDSKNAAIHIFFISNKNGEVEVPAYCVNIF